jgi:hypothetical protein
MLIGPPSDTTWLHFAHRVDPANGGHKFRAATSRDGDNSRNDPAATSRFDYFRVYRP